MATTHVPVMLAEVVRLCAPQAGKTIIDATFGGGGYSQALWQAGAKVCGFDIDPQAALRAKAWMDSLAMSNDAMSDAMSGGQRAHDACFIASNFAEMDHHLDPKHCEESQSPLPTWCGWEDRWHAVVFDLGMSSFQLDEEGRGFSFQRDEPLDMRMSQQGPSATDLLSTIEENVLADLIYYYGQEPAARKIARAIVQSRHLMRTTGDLARLVASNVPRDAKSKKRGVKQAHHATRTFQAIRMAVNNELASLEKGLDAAWRLLSKGGVLIVVSFHSLEDGFTKSWMKRKWDEGHIAGPLAKPLIPSPEEVHVNVRSRSAKLRFAYKN